VVSCSADGTVRFWHLETCAQLGMAAGEVAFHAIAARDRTIVARDAEGRLWVLEADQASWQQPEFGRVVAGVGDEAPTRMRLRPVAPGFVDVSLEPFVVTSATVELRAVRLLTGPGLWPIPGRPLRLQVDRTGNVFDVVDSAGRLAVPRRFENGRDMRLRVQTRLRTPESPPAEPATATLLLTFFAPNWPGEQDQDFTITADEHTQQYA
jgi:hypothetical protein